METEIAINQLQHFIHCPRQWGLIALGNLWEENFKTVQGDIVHKNVDDPFFREKRGNKVIVRSVPILSERLGLVGIVDCVEYTRDPQGIEIPALHDKFRICIVEYKNGKTGQDGNIKRSDAVQLAAQMICMDEMMGGESTGAIYYHTIRKRFPLECAEEVKHTVEATVSAMRFMLENKQIPPVPPKQNCNHCSMQPVCMPKTQGNASQQQRLAGSWRKEYEEIT